MRILGIDPGTRVTGYAVIDRLTKRSVAYVECGRIEPSPGTRPARIIELADELDALILEFKPDVVSLERAYFGVYPSAVIGLSELRGAFTARASAAGVDLVEYTASQAKKTATGNGGAGKSLVNSMLCTRLGLKRRPTLDESDALAMAYCHAVRARD